MFKVGKQQKTAIIVEKPGSAQQTFAVKSLWFVGATEKLWIK